MSDVMQRLMKAMTVIQSVEPPRIPDGAHAMTAIIEWGPGDRGAHRTATPADRASVMSWRARCSSNSKEKHHG